MTFKDVLKSIKNNHIPTTTKFLDPKEQKLVTSYFADNEFLLDGGYPNAERKRAYFYGDHGQSFTAIKITTHSSYLTLTHQNILGSLMALSITRDSIGDILPKQGIFFITAEIVPIVQNTFDSIGNHPVEITIYNGTIEMEYDYEYYTVSIHSMRIDLVISKICNISRKKANIWIENELIKVNHEVETKSTKSLAVDDVLSIRKQGRFVLIDNGKRSKKGNIILKYGKII